MASIDVCPVFGALARPPMFLGVTSDYFAVIVVMSLCSFIGTNNLAYALLYVPLHAVGWLACHYDPHCFNIMTVKLRLPLSPNKALWGANSYAPI